MYENYMCKKFNKEMLLLSEEVQATIREGRYLSCSHCGSRNIKKKK